MPLPPGFNWTTQHTQVLHDELRPPTREEVNIDKQSDPTANWDWQNPDKIGPGGEALPKYATGWQPNGEADYGAGLSGWWNKARSKIETAYDTGYQEGLKIQTWNRNPIADKNRDAQTVADLKDKKKPQNNQQAVMSGLMEGAKETLNQALWGVLDVLSVPAKVAEKTIGAIGLTVGQGLDIQSGDALKQQFSRNYQASELAYSGIFDATVFEEMNKRLDEGMRSDLAAQEVQIQKKWTLWPELIGQGIIDPLNIVTAFGKSGEQIRLAKQAAKDFHEVANPAVAQILNDVSKLDDAKAYTYIEELVKTQQGLTAATSHADDIAKAGKDLEKLSQSYTLASKTSNAKIAHLANQTGEILMHVVNNSDPAEAVEFIRGMVNSVSPDKVKAAEGIATMMHFADAPALFSKAGNETTVLLSRMVEKYGDNWLDDMARLKDSPAEMTKMLLGKLDEVGEEMFPSVKSMLKAEETVKAAQAGVEITEQTKALAERAKQLPEYVKAATRFHEAAQKIVGPINRGFIGIYMGWNPGFAARNYLNNSMVLLADYGPGILLGNADNAFANAERLHGGVLQGAFSEGGMAASLFPEKVGGNETGIKAAISAAKDKPLSPILAASQTAEANAAKRIIAKTYTDTFERGTKAMVRALTPDLEKAGFSRDIINKLPTYIMQNDGDATRVIAALRSDIQAGTIDLFNDVSRIDPKYKSFLSDAGKWDEYAKNVLQATDKNAANLAAKKIFDDIAQAGDYVYREGQVAQEPFHQFLKLAEKDGGLPSTRGELIALRRDGSRNAIKATESILSEADNLANKFAAETGTALNTGSMKAQRGITGLNTWGDNAAQEADRLNNIALKLYQEAKKGKTDLGALWKAYPELFEGVPPSTLDYKTFADTLWNRYDEVVSKTWGGARDEAIGNVTGYLDDLKAAGVEVPQEWHDVIKTAQEGAQQWDTAVVGRFGEKVAETEKVAAGTRATKIAEIAQKYGISSATEAGAPLDKKILSIINKYGETTFKSLNEPIDLKLVEEAFANKAGVRTAENVVTDQSARYAELNAKLWDPKTPKEEIKVIRDEMAAIDNISPAGKPQTAYFDDAGNLVEPRKRLLPPPPEESAVPVSRAIFEQKEDVGKMQQWVLQDIEKNFGKKQLIDKSAEQGMQLAEKELTQKLAENRLISSRVAQANRDFTLLNYGQKSYWDTALAYLYPFHFWYGGTYKTWLSRIAQNPSVLANYARYKENLANVHAGMPEWWKYNVNTNDLPGIHTDNPLYFNLEATLWPLNGLTGLDFNDSSKNVNWWTNTLNFMNKFGPSTWTPLSMVTGLALHAKGEVDAGDKWMGRLFPQSATIKAAGSLLGIANLETDPLVNLFQGGLDPYERRRAQRALATMMQDVEDGNSPYTKEQIQDAAYNQKGEIWDQAVKMAVNGRAPSQVSSFLFGVGFKGRTEQDMEIDKFQTDYARLWAMRPNLSPQEFSQGMEALKSKYDFMDTVLLSKRDGVERDAGLAYNVLTRIPPGKTSDIAKAVGIDPRLLEKFFNDKGQIDQWNKSDYQRLMAGVLDISAILEIPTDTTRKEWLQAKNTYKTAMDEAKGQFGENIWDMVDGYYAAKTQGYDQADAYLQRHPEVQKALDWKSERIMNSPLLSSYYGGANVIESYYRSQMYGDIEKKLGQDIFDTMDEYNDLKTYGNPKESKTFYNQHVKEIKQYYALRDQWQATIDQNVSRLSAQIPEGQNATIRPDANLTSIGAQDLATSLQPQQQMTLQDFQAVIPQHTMGLVQDYIERGDKLPASARTQLERLARDMGYASADDLIQAIGTSMYQTNP